MEILNGNEKGAIERAVRLLDGGEIVAFPTETVYGLGAVALNRFAVAKIFEVKGRPRFDPLIVHLDSQDRLNEVAEDIPDDAKKLMERFWPGPLTMILQKRRSMPDIVTAGLPTVGVRVPSHPVALELLRVLDKPIAAPSANPFGYMSPTKVRHVKKSFADRVPLVLDGGDSMFGIESTIVSFRREGILVHRHGAVSVEELSEHVRIVRDERPSGLCESPGELPYHYAPMKPLILVNGPHEVIESTSSFLAFREPPGPVNARHVKVLSKEGSLREAAANFFSFLIDLDRDDVNVIYAEKVPEAGIGRAVMDRLRKASRKHSEGTVGRPVDNCDNP